MGTAPVSMTLLATSASSGKETPEAIRSLISTIVDEIQERERNVCVEDVLLISAGALVRIARIGEV